MKRDGSRAGAAAADPKTIPYDASQPSLGMDNATALGLLLHRMLKARLMKERAPSLRMAATRAPEAEAPPPTAVAAAAKASPSSGAGTSKAPVGRPKRGKTRTVVSQLPPEYRGTVRQYMDTHRRARAHRDAWMQQKRDLSTLSREFKAKAIREIREERPPTDLVSSIRLDDGRSAQGTVSVLEPRVRPVTARDVEEACIAEVRQHLARLRPDMSGREFNSTSLLAVPRAELLALAPQVAARVDALLVDPSRLQDRESLVVRTLRPGRSPSAGAGGGGAAGGREHGAVRGRDPTPRSSSHRRHHHRLPLSRSRESDSKPTTAKPDPSATSSASRSGSRSIALVRKVPRSVPRSAPPSKPRRSKGH